MHARFSGTHRWHAAGHTSKGVCCVSGDLTHSIGIWVHAPLSPRSPSSEDDAGDDNDDDFMDYSDLEGEGTRVQLPRMGAGH